MLPPPIRIQRPGQQVETQKPPGRVVKSLKDLGAFIARHR